MKCWSINDRRWFLFYWIERKRGEVNRPKMRAMEKQFKDDWNYFTSRITKETQEMLIRTVYCTMAFKPSFAFSSALADNESSSYLEESPHKAHVSLNITLGDLVTSIAFSVLSTSPKIESGSLTRSQNYTWVVVSKKCSSGYRRIFPFHADEWLRFEIHDL